MIFLLILSAIVSQAPGTVILNEVMYNPDGVTLGLDDHLEWIEIFNSSTEAVNLSGMMISDGNNQVYLGHYLLSPGSFGVICANDESFKAVYGNSIRLVPWSGEWTRLRNSSDEIILYSEDGTVMESLRYEESWGANGAEPSRADGGGASLERKNAAGPDDETNWQPSEDYANPTPDNGGDSVCWGTPGAENSISD